MLTYMLCEASEDFSLDPRVGLRRQNYPYHRQEDKSVSSNGRWLNEYNRRLPCFQPLPRHRSHFPHLVFFLLERKVFSSIFGVSPVKVEKGKARYEWMNALDLGRPPGKGRRGRRKRNTKEIWNEVKNARMRETEKTEGMREKFVTPRWLIAF